MFIDWFLIFIDLHKLFDGQDDPQIQALVNWNIAFDNTGDPIRYLDAKSHYRLTAWRPFANPNNYFSVTV